MTGDTMRGSADGTDVGMIDELRRLAEWLAVSGGDVARRMLAELAVGGGLGSRSKSSATDPVTVIDTAVEDHLRGAVAERRPGDRILGEEGGESAADAAEAVGPAAVDVGAADRVRWIVDPVDGTVNLLYGIPFTAVSVAAEVRGRVVAGAVHNITTGETWTAGLGRGATVRVADGDAAPISASDRTELGLALVGTGFAYDAGMRAEQGAVVARLLPRVRDIRRCGSAALDLCMLATGRLDAYYERGLKPWDHAAGALVAQEAGAVVSVSDDATVATTAAAPGVAREFLAALAEAGGSGASGASGAAGASGVAGRDEDRVSS